MYIGCIHGIASIVAVVNIAARLISITIRQCNEYPEQNICLMPLSLFQVGLCQLQSTAYFIHVIDAVFSPLEADISRLKPNFSRQFVFLSLENLTMPRQRSNNHEHTICHFYYIFSGA